jgi:hypothetical protein
LGNQKTRQKKNKKKQPTKFYNSYFHIKFISEYGCSVKYKNNFRGKREEIRGKREDKIIIAGKWY